MYWALLKDAIDFDLEYDQKSSKTFIMVPSKVIQ
jgi:hypothetical protein